MSEGCAPTDIQYLMRSIFKRSSFMPSLPFGIGSYVPTCKRLGLRNLQAASQLVASYVFDGLPIAGLPRVSCHKPIKRSVFAAKSGHSNANHHDWTLAK